MQDLVSGIEIKYGGYKYSEKPAIDDAIDQMEYNVCRSMKSICNDIYEIDRYKLQFGSRSNNLENVEIYTRSVYNLLKNIPASPNIPNIIKKSNKDEDEKFQDLINQMYQKEK